MHRFTTLIRTVVNVSLNSSRTYSLRHVVTFSHAIDSINKRRTLTEQDINKKLQQIFSA